MLSPIHTFESLKIKSYRFLWLGQLSTSMGQWMDQISRTWLIYDITRSPLQLGLVSAVRGIPLLIFGALAGAVADRYDRKAQLIIAQTVNAFLNLVLAFLIMTGRVETWHIYATGFLAGTVQAFQQPARQVLISDMVGERQLLNAIALNSAALNLSRSVGPAAGGLLIQALGVDYSYFAQAAMFALATVWTVQMKTPRSPAITGYSEERAKAGTSIFQSTGEGIGYILSHRIVLAMIILGLAPIVLGMPFMSLMPIFAIDVFHGGASLQGLLLTMVGIGAVAGALGIASLGGLQGSGKLMLSGAMGFGLSLVLFSQSPYLWLAMVFALVTGFANSSYTSQNQTVIQLIVPRDMRGRVLGIYMLNRGLMPLGSLLAGLLASIMGGPLAVTVMGVSCFLLALAVVLWVPGLWRLNLASGSYKENV